MQSSKLKSGESEEGWLVVQHESLRLPGCTLNHWWHVLHYSIWHLRALAVKEYPLKFENRNILWWNILLLYQLLIRWSLGCKSLGSENFQL